MKRVLTAIISMAIGMTAVLSQDVSRETSVRPEHAVGAVSPSSVSPSKSTASPSAQTPVRTYVGAEVHFRLDDSRLDPDYMGNAESLRNFARMVDSIGTSHIDSIVVRSQSSPEGVYEHNIKLSRLRARAMREYMESRHPELSSLVRVEACGESWLRLREYVAQDTKMKESTIARVLSIIDSDVNVGTKKWRLQQLPVYRYLLSTYYPRIRNSMLYIIYCHTEEGDTVRRTTAMTSPRPALLSVSSTAESLGKECKPLPVGSTAQAALWRRNLYVKTDLAAWSMAISNLSVEVDLLPHWSFTLPAGYSAWNYGRSTLKFRTLYVRPEVRYWLRAENEGFFGGAHFGMAYYNLAFDGEYRYQDREGRTPALGGGVSVGYRLPIGKSARWAAEFSLGAGCYSLDYDIFYNTPHTPDGRLMESRRETYWGIDHVGITVSYRIDLSRKGGRR